MANFFPRWTNLLPLKIAVCVIFIVLGLTAAFSYYGTPKAQRVGYQPDQPIAYDHDLHANQLGIDCRYCHSSVDKSASAGVPTANTCWNCHQHVQKDNPKLEPLRRAVDKNYEKYDGKPIEWVRIHKMPDYAYFDHSAHVNRGVSCKSCHGDVHKMRKVYHAKSLSMAFCIECHREPEKHLRPLEEVYNLDYDVLDYLKEKPELAEKIGYEKGDSAKQAQLKLGKLLKKNWDIHPKESCTTCHR